MKSGVKTSEFYLVLGNMIAGLMVMTGFLLPERLDEVGTLVSQAIGAIVALGSLVGYIVSRTEYKSKFIDGKPQQG